MLVTNNAKNKLTIINCSPNPNPNLICIIVTIVTLINISIPNANTLNMSTFVLNVISN